MEEKTNTQNNENKEEIKEEKKSKKPILWIVITIVLLIIACVLLLKYLPKQSNLDHEMMSCIGENSLLVASKGCGYCHNQIEMFGDDKDSLNIIYCEDDEQFCIDNQIAGVPTWIINEEKFVGVRTIDELKELTGC